jgi:hypothetical protein
MIALLTSVDYADYLAVTLPAWQRMLPTATLRVVTSRTDRATRRVAERLAAEVHQTNAWRADGATFNRAKALDEAIGRPTPGEVCLSIDADVYPLGTFPSDDAIAPGVLYGCARYLCRTSADVAAHLDGRVPREALPLMDTRLTSASGYGITANTLSEIARTAGACLGFFQCFRYAGQRFGSYPTTGGYDTAFAAQFADRRPLQDFYVLHLGPSAGRNWGGRTLPRWRAA